MRITPPRKHRGDRLTADHVNDLSLVSRAASTPFGASYSHGIVMSSGLGHRPPKPFRMCRVEVYEVIEPKEYKRYRVKPRYNNNTNPHDVGEPPIWATNEDVEDWILDAGDHLVTLGVGDKVEAYWSDQRGAWLPVTTPESDVIIPPTPVLDCKIRPQSLYTATDGGGSSAIEFCLERSATGNGGWGSVNSRKYIIDSNVTPNVGDQISTGGCGLYRGKNSGVGIYSVIASAPTYLRVTAQSKGTPTSLTLGALRIWAANRKELGTTLVFAGEPLGDQAHLSGLEVETASGFLPGFFVILDGKIILLPPAGEIWTFIVDVGLILDFSLALKYKPIANFTLSETLTTADANKQATLTSQFGDGVENNAAAVTVHNLPASTDYVFSGVSGAKGIAAMDDCNNYRILNMECP